MLSENQADSVILIVDDDWTSRAIIGYWLSLLNFKTIEAGDGLEAIKLVADNSPLLIVSDVQMPKMDGYGLLSELKKNVQWSKIPVVMMTSNIHEKRETALAAGASELLIKFPECDSFLATIRYFIGDIKNIG